jgi:ectoine hydroxylase-related dioxygenase (phytanoyl-CoA dioxygenase family)
MALLDRLFNRSTNLSSKQRKFWDQNGYLVLKGFLKPKGIRAYLDELDSLWENRKHDDNPLVIDFWEGELTGHRMHFKNAPDGSRRFISKLNDVHFVSEGCRNLILDEALASVLAELLGGDPLAIGTLTFEKGSEQEDHFDTYYMPAPCAGEMVVSSIFLEKVGDKQGPVRVYPKSHLIPPYQFSDGNIYVSDKHSEMPLAKGYIRKELSDRGIREEVITGDIGDVLIWHGQLYHGGTPIEDKSLTRKSLVTHYWDKRDVLPEQAATHQEGAYYLIRDHQKTTH